MPENKTPLHKIIVDGDVDTLIKEAKILGEKAAGEDLGRTQIRNIYGMVKKLQAKSERDYSQLKLFIPKLRYAAARQSKLSSLVNALCDGISLVEENDDRFENFANFFESVVAYHYVAFEKKKNASKGRSRA